MDYLVIFKLDFEYASVIIVLPVPLYPMKYLGAIRTQGKKIYGTEIHENHSNKLLLQ